MYKDVLQVILGGGRSKFLPNNTLDCDANYGHRQDNRNLIDEWMNIDRFKGARKEYVKNLAELNSFDVVPPDYLFGI